MRDNIKKFFDYDPGKDVPEIRDLKLRPGQVIFVGGSDKDVRDYARMVNDGIKGFNK